VHACTYDALAPALAPAARARPRAEPCAHCLSMCIRLRGVCAYRGAAAVRSGTSARRREGRRGGRRVYIGALRTLGRFVHWGASYIGALRRYGVPSCWPTPQPLRVRVRLRVGVKGGRVRVRVGVRVSPLLASSARVGNGEVEGAGEGEGELPPPSSVGRRHGGGRRDGAFLALKAARYLARGHERSGALSLRGEGGVRRRLSRSAGA